MRRTLAGLLRLAVLLVPTAAWPQAAEPALPEVVQAGLQQARVAPEDTAFLVVPLDGGALHLAEHADVPMNPASTMKLLTTYAALELLGPDYRWRTSVFASRAPRNGRLDGDLIVRGDGDPSLVIERWWLLVQHLRALGLQEIRGDLVLDRSRYGHDVDAGPALDHNDLRPYNVAPDALLLNYKALSLEFVPDPGAGIARIVATPALDGEELPARVPLAPGSCGDWKARLKADFGQARAPRFHGSYPAACGTRSWHLSLLDADDYALASFRALWRQAGGRFHGTVRAGHAGPQAFHLLDQESPPLGEVIRDINKNSNNVMARQLFLTLGAPRERAPAGESEGGEPGSAWGAAPEPVEAQGVERSAAALHAWLAREDLAMPELVLQNGSGLSRQERISAGSLGRLLAHAWSGNDMPAFLASLPLAGVDGTMRKRKSAVHAAYVKTGYLAEVRALAGYVFAASGKRYAIVGLINDPHAEGAQGVLDDFLQWVWEKG